MGQTDMCSDRSTNIGTAQSVTINQVAPNFQRRPALISQVVKRLSSLTLIDETPSNQLENTYNIEAKLEFNHVFKYRPLIEEYGDYGHNVIKILSTIDQEKIGSERKILKLINDFYKECIGNLRRIESYSEQKREIIEVIRSNSDQIIEDVINKTITVINNSSNGQDMDEEDLIFGVKYIVGHAFIECKVLERPQL